jgi:two-component system chemotaxis response regulator CheY
MILIIDADRASAPFLARLLRYNGHPAEVVPSGMEALALLPTRSPAAIILDLDLPDLPGLTLLKALRADPEFLSIPILVYTSDFSPAAADAARTAGALDVIVKGTIGVQALLARIVQHLPARSLRPHDPSRE